MADRSAPSLKRRLAGSSLRGVLVILVVEVAVFALLTMRHGDGGMSSPYWSSRNLKNTALAMSFVGLLAVGETLVILSGGIDLSVGSLLAVGNVISACLMSRELNQAPWPPLLACAIGVLVPAALGLCSGLLVALVKLPPFVATLGMMSVGRGLAYLVSSGQPIRGLPPPFGETYRLALRLGDFELFVPTLVLIGLAVVLSVVLGGMRFGRYLYAIGGNESAAFLAGVPVRRLKVLVYTLSGAIAGLAGVLTVLHYGVGDSTSGTGYELDAIAACVIGGVSLAGGEGTILGPLIGAAIMAALDKGLIMVEVKAEWKQIAVGAILIGAVVVDFLQRRRRS
jgi:ribose/xylose/arabinose/galactoside ABC-type transport system permease subunit